MMPRKKPVRDNQYYLQRLAHEHPNIHADLLSGRIKSPAEAFDLAGLKKRRTPLQQLETAWAKASTAERDAFKNQIGCAQQPIPSATPASITPSKIHMDRRLLPQASKAIRLVMTKRKMKMGQVMKELGFSPLDASIGNGLDGGCKLQPHLLSALEIWIQKNVSMLVDNLQKENPHARIVQSTSPTDLE